MNTKVVILKQDKKETEQILQEAGEIIKSGGVVAFPTETVYGLGAHALKADSAKKIYAAKDRPSDNPLIIHISQFEDIYSITSNLPEAAVQIAKAFWPGPLTMILPKGKSVPYETTGGLDTVAVRLPEHPIARKLIEHSGGFVAAPSANRSGRPSPTLAQYVIEDMQGRIDMIIDGGEVGIGIESTIIDLTISPPQILRPGAITLQMLRNLLGEVEVDSAILSENSTKAPRAPGMKYRHYAPKGELVIVTGKTEFVIKHINHKAEKAQKAGEKTGIIGSFENIKQYRCDVVKCIGSREDEESIAKNLYRILREFDTEGITQIYSESFEGDGMGDAIMNRLLKAAGHRIEKAAEV
ncbi:threonylcarbamoyl-AMP synthase [Lachnospiraceae bacterium OttesenSCG-928-D06]|nr:threonylcarbamoyl-AMP synthase [Lachnospiraceae bacterium OttesenSCG-928-D06]